MSYFLNMINYIDCFLENVIYMWNRNKFQLKDYMLENAFEVSYLFSMGFRKTRRVFFLSPIYFGIKFYFCQYILCSNLKITKSFWIWNFFLEYKIQEIKLLMYIRAFKFTSFFCKKCTSFSLQNRVTYSGKKTYVSY